MSAQNGIMGNEFGVELPRTELDEETKQIVSQAAKFAKSKEFAVLKEHLNARINFYQNYLPDGRPVVQILDKEQLHTMWIASNVIIGELNAIIQAYEQAANPIQE